jgi:hypothetical protein
MQSLTKKEFAELFAGGPGAYGQAQSKLRRALVNAQ